MKAMFAGIALLMLAISTQTLTAAVEFPTKVVTIVVGFPPGGTADIQARILAKGLAEKFGKPVIVENRPGASGRIGTAHVARAVSDGHTILLGSISTFSIEPVLRKNVGYDVSRDLAPITLLSEMPFLLVVSPNIPPRTAPDVVAYARNHPGQLTYASWGIGTSSHLVAEQFIRAKGLELVHVPYKGAVEALTDIMGGNVSMMFALPSDAIPHVKSGKLRAIAVTGSRRLAALPDVSTLAESGINGINFVQWFGLVVSAKTPPAVVMRLRTEFSEVIRSQAFKTWVDSQGGTAIPGSPEELTSRIQADAASAASLAKSIGLTLDE